MGDSSEHGLSQTYYRYVDRKGTSVIVDQLDKVPKAFREQAEALTVVRPKERASTEKEGGGKAASGFLGGQAASSAFSETLQVKALEVKDTLMTPGALHVPSLILGVSATILSVLCARFVKGHRTFVIKLALGLTLLSFLGSAYLGFVRKSVGFAGGPISSPAQILNDVQQAKAAMEKSTEERIKVADSVE